MFIIGEKINGLFKNVSEAIQTKNKLLIQELAKNQAIFKKTGGKGAGEC